LPRHDNHIGLAIKAVARLGHIEQEGAEP